VPDRRLGRWLTVPDRRRGKWSMLKGVPVHMRQLLKCEHLQSVVLDHIERTRGEELAHIGEMACQTVRQREVLARSVTGVLPVQVLDHTALMREVVLDHIGEWVR